MTREQYEKEQRITHVCKLCGKRVSKSISVHLHDRDQWGRKINWSGYYCITCYDRPWMVLAPVQLRRTANVSRNTKKSDLWKGYGMWIQQTEETCPKCEHFTEVFQDEKYRHAERCTHCKWQVNFSPEVKRVPYGNEVNTELWVSQALSQKDSANKVCSFKIYF